MELLYYKYHREERKHFMCFGSCSAFACTAALSRFWREMCIKKGSDTKPSLRFVKISTLCIRLRLFLCFYLHSCARCPFCWQEVCSQQEWEKLEVRNLVKQSTNMPTGECSRAGQLG